MHINGNMGKVRGTAAKAPKQDAASDRATKFRGAFLEEFGWRVREMRLREIEKFAAQGKYKEIMEWCRRNPRFMQDGIEAIEWELEKGYRAAMDGKGKRPSGVGGVLEFIALNAKDWSLGAWAVRELAEDGEMERVRKVAEGAVAEKVRKYAAEKLRIHSC